METIQKGSKEFKVLAKEVKVSLNAEFRSLSHVVRFITKSAISGNCKKLVMSRLGLEKLPKSDEVQKALIEAAKSGFKFYSEDGTILNCRKRFEKDQSGKVIYMDGKPVICETWYVEKEAFTFTSIWNAIFSPSKAKIIIPESDIKTAE